MWRGACGVAVGIAITAALTAVSGLQASVPRVPVPLAISAVFVAVAVCCLLADLDVNRGRKVKETEVVMEEFDDAEPGAG